MLLTDFLMTDHVFPVPPQTQLPLLPDSELQGAPWYWGGVSRAEVSVLLKDCPDGTFMIRDSTNGKPGHYTLTLRSGGQTVLLRILTSEGRFGFSEPLQFQSVLDLVQFHRTRTLSRYNSALTVRLELPFCRPQNVELKDGAEASEKHLQNNYRRFTEKKREYDRLQGQLQQTTQEIQMKRTSIEAFKETIKIFEDQCSSQDQDSNQDCGLDLDRLKFRLDEIRETRSRLEQELESRLQDLRDTEQRLDQLSPELVQIYRTTQDLLSWLSLGGAPQRQMEEWAGHTELLLSDPDLDCGLRSWFMSGLSRSEAEDLLQGKPSGTFLIRESSRKDCYACSVVVASEVKHCVIYSSDHGLGFEPSTLFWSLQDLVQFYGRTSLAQHNRTLDVRLLVPAFAQRHYEDGKNITENHHEEGHKPAELGRNEDRNNVSEENRNIAKNNEELGHNEDRNQESHHEEGHKPAELGRNEDRNDVTESHHEEGHKPKLGRNEVRNDVTENHHEEGHKPELGRNKDRNDVTESHHEEGHKPKLGRNEDRNNVSEENRNTAKNNEELGHNEDRNQESHHEEGHKPTELGQNQDRNNITESHHEEGHHATDDNNHDPAEE